MWKNYLKRIGDKNIEFKDLMNRINRFLSPIYRHILKEDEFFKIWDNKQLEWKKQK